MKLYMASVYESNFHVSGRHYANITPAERYWRDQVQWILGSYHYIRSQNQITRLQRDGIKIFLDSGAFSAMTKGVEIDVREYVQYIQRYRSFIEVVDGQLVASVLDSVGDPAKTYQNQQAMESLGVKPLPCFHYGEDERWLEWYISRYEYITLGGMVPISTPQLYIWLDRMWDRYLTDGAGRPRIRVHGFGLTNLGLMERYPWYSVDSSTWQKLGSNGAVLLPDHGAILVSPHRPEAKVAGRHYNTIPAVEQRAVCAMVEKLGFEMARLQNDYRSRWAFNLWAFLEISKRLNARNDSFKAEQLGLF